MAINDLAFGDTDQFMRARDMAHSAVQLLAAAANANLPAKADDSHIALSWDKRLNALVASPMETPDGRKVRIALGFEPFALNFHLDQDSVETIVLHDVFLVDVELWLHRRLASHGLQTSTRVSLSYSLPERVEALTIFDAASIGASLRRLSAWYRLADRTIGAFRQGLAIGAASPVRCWPHHFDIAAYVVLEEGAPEIARGVGVGMAPGDALISQPYFYINPWPAPEMTMLAALGSFGRWNAEGFVGVVAEAETIFKNAQSDKDILVFLNDGFSASLRAIGCAES